MRERRIVPGQRGSLVGRVLTDRRAIHIHDAESDPGYALTEMSRIGGFHTLLGTPLLREGEPIGVIVLGRNAVQPFNERQIELATTFADQAVIAIENTRLFEAEQQRTQELTESLEQQTATSRVLDVISRSAFDLQAVFETVAENSVRLCGADRAFIFRFDGELLRVVATFNVDPPFRKWVEQNPIRPGRRVALAGPRSSGEQSIFSMSLLIRKFVRSEKRRGVSDNSRGADAQRR